ncbi:MULTISPECIES: MFS transporter [Rhodomicrobium]|uniref:MFS transporter n=1 Tax=Rhodomicrobium TaxID=1068 RepID=UPI000B4BF2FE|nr:MULTISPECIES: MFS transporter [Rhodomicrobium]
MLEPLRNRTYRQLFAAQVIALVGTGLLTVALGLLAYELAGGDGGAVLGTALAIKMIAYVGVSPIAGAVAGLLPRRAMLVALDLARAAVALCLPFVDQVWQIYALIFILQSASAAFTPTFQATIPDILPDENDYTKALSLSRLAYDLETLLSPALAAALLTMMSFHNLFAGTALGFLVSAAFVLSVALPQPKPTQAMSFAQRLTRGARIYLATPRLQGLLALNLAAAAGVAIVFVNTVVIVRDRLALGDGEVAITLAAFGFGSMAAAFALPRLLERLPDRAVMLSGAGLLIPPLLGAAFALRQIEGADAWSAILIAWPILGAAYAMVVTPAGRLLRRSARDADRPALFAAQFALSHACWLVTYPMAGWLGAIVGLPLTLIAHAGVVLFASALALRLWPANDPDIVEHVHADLPPSHPHVREQGGPRHAHIFVIDELHRRWPA